MSSRTLPDLEAAAAQIKAWGYELGFQQIAITDADAGRHADHLRAWLGKGYHGEMSWMASHGSKRWDPAELLPGTCRVISARMDYLPADDDAEAVLASPEKAYISRYALGRDYHKLLRKRLATLAERIHAEIAPHQFRAFVDSAPVLERAFAEKAGLGWIGKNSMLINSRAGSWFFLGEICTDLPLPVDPPQQTMHCGSCSACLDICPTGAIVAPGQVDARRCISYLTIELKGSIPEPLRPLLGNRIYGCDDCQLVCPWNKFARASAEPDFQPRHRLADSDLVELFGWSEAEFLARTEGSAIRRIGYERWLRNIAVALGNAPFSETIVGTLNARAEHPSALVREHVAWALQRQEQKRPIATA
ncbi:MAG: tRNA epoxyqueuosine(34) reductase QueG [Spongiibacteraceae bacterium]|jgi:epoxyqueuosine reductase|nr:tRNA epoxyqueuosine(34) reductase QueG [Spongiibacteraceae bacterium]